ncbi:hypothetical protein DITRI_Ditri07aG0098400 [Diplodiscus trichospermus]
MTLLTSTSTTCTTDKMSEKTVEMDVVTSMDLSPYSTGQQPQSGSRFNNVPSYMAPTQSAKAKVRSQGQVKTQRGPYIPQWSPSKQQVAGCDSLSSGGGTTIFQSRRSPSPKNNGARLPSRRLGGCSPDAGSGGEDLRLPFGSSHDW